MTDATHRLTPTWILDRIRMMAPIGLDPCTFADNPTDAVNFYTKEDDGLSFDWIPPISGIVFVNEPYSRKESPLWAQKIYVQANRGCEIVRLTKLSGAGWAHDSVWNLAQAVCILRQRPRHPTPDGDSKGSGKFDSVVAYYGDRARLFARVFGDVGRVILL
jgi:hypothetical protein